MTPQVCTAELRRLVDAVGHLSPALDDADRIDRVRLFEELRSITAAAQAEEAVAFDRSQRAAQAVAQVPTARQGRGIAAQLGLARRISPWAAQRWLGFAKIATAELPATFRELKAGRTSEWRAMLIARETVVLSREARAEVDSDLAPRLQDWGDKRVGDEARKAAYRLDPEAVVNRARRAEQDRHVASRPVPDTMCRVSALLPVAQGVACHAALRKDADAIVGHGGETRNRSQVMADLFVERLTGQAVAGDVSVELELVITDQSLFDSGPGRDEPAHLVGYGPIPAGVARDLALNADRDGDADDVADGVGANGTRWIRRLFTHPTSGQLIAMESKRRLFTTAQQRFLRVRDQVCRTPYCGAPIRHADHIRPAAGGGPTAVSNARGTCEACNYANAAPGWVATVAGDVITTVTPTGHRYRSRAPDLPGQATARLSKIELKAWRLLDAAVAA